MAVKGRMMKFTALVMVWLMVSLSIPQFPVPDASKNDGNDFTVQIAKILSSLGTSVASAETSGIKSVTFSPNPLIAGSTATVNIIVSGIQSSDISSVTLQFYDGGAAVSNGAYTIAPGLNGGQYAQKIAIPKELSGSISFKVHLTGNINVIDFIGTVSVQAQQTSTNTPTQNQYIATCEPCVQAGRTWCISYGSSGVPTGSCAAYGVGCVYGQNAYSVCPTQLSCQDACTASYYGAGGSYSYNYNYNSYYGTTAYGQASYGQPVGACYNRYLQTSSIMLFYTQMSSSSANAANAIIGTPHQIPALGLCSDPEDVCWCAVLNLNAAVATGTATIPGTTMTSHWPPNDQYYVKSADEPKKSATDADCTQKSTLQFSNVRVNNQSARTQTKLIAAGQPITVDGEVKFFSTTCNGYQYTCEKFKQLTCDKGKEGFLGMTQYQRYKDCAKVEPDMPNRLGAEGEDSSFCWGCLADIGIVLLEVAAIVFLNVPPEVAVQVGQALMQLTPALDGCPADWIGASFQAANAIKNIPKSTGTTTTNTNNNQQTPTTKDIDSNKGGNSLNEEDLAAKVTGATIGVASAEEIPEVCDVQPNNIDFAEEEKNIYLQDELLAGQVCDGCSAEQVWCDLMDPNTGEVIDSYCKSICDDENEVFVKSCSGSPAVQQAQQNQQQISNQQQNQQQSLNDINTCSGCVNSGGRWCGSDFTINRCKLPSLGLPAFCSDLNNAIGVYGSAAGCYDSSLNSNLNNLNTNPQQNQQQAGTYTGNSNCVPCVRDLKTWCALRDSRGVIVAGVCVDDQAKCRSISGATPIVGNPYMCPSEPSYGADDAVASVLQQMPYMLPAWSCDLLKDKECWSVCGREYTMNATASPRCNQGGPVKKYTEAQYTCAAPVSCGSLSDHPVTVQFVQGDTVVKEDTTTTDENGKFSLTVTAPNVNGEVSVIIKASV